MFFVKMFSGIVCKKNSSPNSYPEEAGRRYSVPRLTGKNEEAKQTEESSHLISFESSGYSNKVLLPLINLPPPRHPFRVQMKRLRSVWELVSLHNHPTLHVWRQHRQKLLCWIVHFSDLLNKTVACFKRS